MDARCGTLVYAAAGCGAHVCALCDVDGQCCGMWRVWMRAVGRWLAVRRHLMRMGASDETLVDAVAGWGAYACALRDVGGGSGGTECVWVRWVGRCGLVLCHVVRMRALDGTLEAAVAGCSAYGCTLQGAAE